MSLSKYQLGSLFLRIAEKTDNGEETAHFDYQIPKDASEIKRSANPDVSTLVGDPKIQTMNAIVQDLMGLANDENIDLVNVNLVLGAIDDAEEL